MIATHGRTGWRRLAFGSVAEKVVRYGELAGVRPAREGNRSIPREQAKTTAAASQYSPPLSSDPGLFWCATGLPSPEVHTGRAHKVRNLRAGKISSTPLFG